MIIWQKHKGLISVLLALAAGMCSCHDVVVRDTPQNVFEVFWTTLDEHYVYFEEKGVDWDSMYVAYAPRVKQVRTDAELLSLLHEMIVPLQDGHVAIVTSNTVVYSKMVYYGKYYSLNVESLEYEIMNAEKYYPELDDGYDYTQLLMKWDCQLVEDCPEEGEEGCCRYQEVCTNGRGPVLLLRIPTFSSVLSETYYEEVLGDYMQNRLKQNSMRGVILDLRSNVGGMINNVYALISNFYEGEKKLYYNRYKTGRGKTDVGEKVFASIVGKGTVGEDIPVVLLISASTYSAANTASFIMSAFPNVTLIGEKTGGGGGSRRDVALPNGWVLCYTGEKHYALDDVDMELGIEPDIHVPYDGEETLDIPLLTAVEYLENLWMENSF